MRACSPTQVKYPEIGKQTIKIIKKDSTIYKDTIIYKPGPVKIIPGKDIPQKVDTTAILKDYFAKVYYQDTLKLDTLGFILVKDTISQNRIQKRHTNFNIKVPVYEKTINNYVQIPPRNKVYIGIEIGGNTKDIINYIGPNFILNTKKDKMYNLGLGLTPNGLGFNIGTSWKIQLKKP